MSNGMAAVPQKVQGFAEMTPPKYMKEVESLIGLLNYMQPFILNLRHHNAPFGKATGKGKTFYWDEACNSTFKKLENIMSESLKHTLMYFNRR